MESKIHTYDPEKATLKVGNLKVNFGSGKTVIAAINPDVNLPTGEYLDNSPKVISRISTSRIFGGCYGEWEVFIPEEPKDKKQPIVYDQRRSFKDIKNLRKGR